MKKTLFSALILMTLMTACHENERIVPQTVTTTAPSETSEPDNDATRVPTVDHGQALPAAVSQNSQPGELAQPSGRDGAVGNVPVHHGGQALEVMPADTLARVF